MEPPSARLRLGGCDLLLLGTIAGFAPEGERVRSAFQGHAPQAVGLGIPPEDLETLRTLASSPGPHDLPDLDPHSQRLMDLLGRFGATRVPSPDLEALYALATAGGAALEALDLPDVAHAEVYTRLVKFRHVIQSNSVQRKLLKQEFAECGDPYALALAFDAFQARPKPVLEVERIRERHMAVRLREACKGRERVLAVVPAARFAGVLEELQAAAPAAAPPSAPSAPPPKAPGPPA